MFQAQSANYLRNDHLRRIELAIAPLTIDQIWWRPNEPSNSIGNLMLHLAGNVRQWILGGVAREQLTRDRDFEFSTREQRSIEDLSAMLRSTVEDACAVIEQVTDRELAEPRTIQRFDTTVFGAI